MTTPPLAGKKKSRSKKKPSLRIGIVDVFLDEPEAQPSTHIPAKKKSLKVDRQQFEGIVKKLIQAEPVKREDVKIAKKKPEKLIPPPK